MEITILTFGQITDITGTAEWKEAGIMDTETLRQKLEGQFTALSQVKYAMAVDKKMINANTQLTDGAVVALLPPFSGG
jgi:molybdopterin converting factor small subunit